MNNYFVDTETCGLSGVPVLLQYAINDGPIRIHNIWTTPIQDTLDIIRDIVDNRVICHNLRFDWFHLSKIYNMFMLAGGGMNRTPPIEAYSVKGWADLEYESRFGACLKPRDAICTMIMAQKGDYQSAVTPMKPVYVRKVPVGMVDQVCLSLNDQTDLPWILFAGLGNPDKRWHVLDRKDELGVIDPSWKDVKISFKPSNSLKDLSKFLLDHEPSARFDEIALPQELWPTGEGYAPYAKLISSADKGWEYDGGFAWPALLDRHIGHWASDTAALEYATDDITMLRKLYIHLGSPTDDQDSMLAAQVASVRLRGFAVDLDKVREQYSVSAEIVAGARINVNSPIQVRDFVAEALDPMEAIAVSNGCGKEVMAKLAPEFILDERESCGSCGVGEHPDTFCHRCNNTGSVGPTGKCDICDGRGNDDDGEKCGRCDGTGLSDDRKMPVVGRFEHIEEVRSHIKRLQLYDKLMMAKRAYPDFNVVGTKSGRMSGAGGLNYHGIEKSLEIRDIFTLADEGQELTGGDYSSQELAIAATTMNDDDLMTDLQSGKSLHGLFGAELFQTTYEDIMANKGEDNSRYDRAKGAVYLMLYGGTFETMSDRSGVDVGICEAAFNSFAAKYPQMASTRKSITDRFSAIIKNRSTDRFEYHEPAQKYIDSIYGFRRHFSTEYMLQKMMFDFLHNIPPAWNEIRVRVNRVQSRTQTICGAVVSALWGAAISIQNKVIRASNNHVIQSTGRSLTMGLQYALWQIQPQGIHPFELTLMSIHDEVFTVSKPELVPRITGMAERTLEEQMTKVPLIMIEWGEKLRSWAHLKSASAKKGDTVYSFGWSEEEVTA